MCETAAREHRAADAPRGVLFGEQRLLERTLPFRVAHNAAESEVCAPFAGRAEAARPVPSAIRRGRRCAVEDSPAERASATLSQKRFSSPPLPPLLLLPSPVEHHSARAAANRRKCRCPSAVLNQRPARSSFFFPPIRSTAEFGALMGKQHQQSEKKEPLPSAADEGERVSPIPTAAAVFRLLVLALLVIVRVGDARVVRAKGALPRG